MKNGLNNKKFAKAIGISLAGLYNIFAGKSYFTQEKIDIARKLLDIADNEICEIFFTQKVEKN